MGLRGAQGEATQQGGPIGGRTDSYDRGLHTLEYTPCDTVPQIPCRKGNSTGAHDHPRGGQLDREATDTIDDLSLAAAQAHLEAARTVGLGDGIQLLENA
jgi:hypothetical protein